MKQRFIMVGAGGFSLFWQKLFLPEMKEFAIPVAAVDVSEEALRNPVENGVLPPEKCYLDARRAIEENPCDFLVLIIPPQARMAYIDLAIEYGLDVLCEKPLADTMDHACEIYMKMKAAGRKLAVTVSHRFEQSKQSLEELLDTGDYGKLNYIVGKLTMPRGPGSGFHAADRPLEESILNSFSGGLIHELDTFRGLTHSNGKRVFAKLWKFRPEDNLYASTAIASVVMENGVVCTLEHSGSNASGHNGWAHEYYRAECAKATLELDAETLTVCSQVNAGLPLLEQKPLSDSSDIWAHAMIMRDFCAWREGGRPCKTNIDDNMHCCALTFAAVESAIENREVDVEEYLKRYQEKYGFALDC